MEDRQFKRYEEKTNETLKFGLVVFGVAASAYGAVWVACKLGLAAACGLLAN